MYWKMEVTSLLCIISSLFLFLVKQAILCRKLQNLEFEAMPENHCVCFHIFRCTVNWYILGIVIFTSKYY